MTERKFNHQSWFLYYPEEGNTRGAPTQLLRGVEFGIETKALLFKRLCAYSGLHCEVYQNWNNPPINRYKYSYKNPMFFVR